VKLNLLLLEGPLMPEIVLQTTGTTAELECPDCSGRWGFTVVPIFPEGSPGASIERSLEGSLGTYKVTFVLSRPSTRHFHSEMNFPKLMASGDSLLEVPKEFPHLKADYFKDALRKERFAEVIFWTNEAHRLARAEVQVRASNFAEAEKVAHIMVLSMISWWSFQFDVPLDINGYEVEETATEVRRWVFNMEGRSRSFPPDEAGMQIQSSEHLRPIFSAYREGLNAIHPFYQCLSFYKATEGLRSLRGERRREATAAGKAIDEPSEKIPDAEADLSVPDSSAFRPYLGRKYSWVLDQFRGLIRNALAHLDPLQKPLVADSYDDLARCERAVPVLKFIAREMIRNELLARCGSAPVK